MTLIIIYAITTGCAYDVALKAGHHYTTTEQADRTTNISLH